eukprot:CAMPEP_0195136180 /NCGR_PEP_ID=MMETSP0448-20130528/153761_1 /TAXON_ID=66468 /ORGANISM="Heterocapsa triquestra, Strain CCMP 448" /LENGTH=65 /DNA_ID=CAMNT_0040174351 /DNA_START=30 /DNA_END=224 /DNA_ORIENTATION=+
MVLLDGLEQQKKPEELRRTATALRFEADRIIKAGKTSAMKAVYDNTEYGLRMRVEFGGTVGGVCE